MPNGGIDTTSTTINEENLRLLSDRERQVLGMAATGFLDKQIGQELGISLNTLRTYWTRIRGKLGEGPRAALAAVYMANEVRDEAKVHFGPVEHEGWVIDVASMMMIASDGINALHGLSPGMPHPTSAYTHLYHPEDREETRRSLHLVIRGEVETGHLIFRLATESGIHLVNLFMRGIKNRYGEVYKVIGYRSRSMDCRPNHDPQVRLGTWYRNVRTGEFRADKGYCDIFGIDPEADDLREATFDRIHPDDYEVATTYFANAVEQGLDSVENDSRVVSEDGSFFWIRANVRIERYPDGNVVAHGTVAAFR